MTIDGGVISQESDTVTLLPPTDTHANGKELAMPTMGTVGGGGAIRAEVYDLGGRMTLPFDASVNCISPAASKSMTWGTGQPRRATSSC